MSNRKNYNSIFFLTVYLGLVLVGATPQVLAQAAMTRQFDIKSEIVIGDDLDKKPDEDLFLSSVVNLVKELDKISQKGEFDWNVKDELQIEDLSICEGEKYPSYLSFGSITEEADKVIKEFAVELARKAFSERCDHNSESLDSQKLDFDFALNNRDLIIKTKISGDYDIPLKVKSFVNNLTANLSRIKASKKATSEKVVAENTKILTENDQVFIVTRLPRGSIDAVLYRKSAK